MYIYIYLNAILNVNIYIYITIYRLPGPRELSGEKMLNLESTDFERR